MREQAWPRRAARVRWRGGAPPPVSAPWAAALLHLFVSSGVGRPDPVVGRPDPASDSGGGPWMGSVGPWVGSLCLSTGFLFFFFYLIYREAGIWPSSVNND